MLTMLEAGATDKLTGITSTASAIKWALIYYVLAPSLVITLAWRAYKLVFGS